MTAISLPCQLNMPSILICVFCMCLLLLGWCLEVSSSDQRELLFRCDFGDDDTQGDYCGMVQWQDGDINWKLTRSSGRGDTGPLSDHTGNEGGTGRFLWAESSPSSGGRKASISTPLYNLTGDGGLLVFYYHMYGERPSTLEVSVCQDDDSQWSLSGNLGNKWYQQNLTVSCGAEPANISFTATLNTEPSDIAIDDISLYDAPFTTTTSVQGERSSPVVMESSSESISTSSASQTQTSMETTPHSPSYKGIDIVLPVSLGVVALLVAVVIILIVCLCQKRRSVPISKDSVYRYDNHAYNVGQGEPVAVGNGTMGTRGGTATTFNSSTWRSTASSVKYDNRVGVGQTPRQSQVERGTPGTGTQPGMGDRQYFVLNPGRASMALEEGEYVETRRNGVAEESNTTTRPTGTIRSDAPGASQSVRSSRTPESEDRQYFQLNPRRASLLGDENVTDNETKLQSETTKTPAAPYQYIDEVMPTKDAGPTKDESNVNGYELVTVKDDETGGYQFVNEPIVESAGTGSHYLALYETLVPGPDQKQEQEKKPPVPAPRNNIVPKKPSTMVDNILYNPLNGEQRVDNVLYNPLEEK